MGERRSLSPIGSFGFLRRLGDGFIMGLLLLLMSSGLSAGTAAGSSFPVPHVAVARSAGNPLITFETSPSLGQNINGPSVIEAPKWVKKPLGKYYMYFAHHKGRYIRLAYSDDLSGPWKIHEPGVLALEEVAVIKDHIASPDVHVRERRKVLSLLQRWRRNGNSHGRDQDKHQCRTTGRRPRQVVFGA